VRFAGIRPRSADGDAEQLADQECGARGQCPDKGLAQRAFHRVPAGENAHGCADAQQTGSRRDERPDEDPGPPRQEMGIRGTRAPRAKLRNDAPAAASNRKGRLQEPVLSKTFFKIRESPFGRVAVSMTISVFPSADRS
jgi:hypothetical protein